ncbi:MAG: hypothetical protein PF485_10115 [Bacteroidales bacterium]|jgi:hypothetical protein|nr:hypothetical protein [Bacteroidales bacterium]
MKLQFKYIFSFLFCVTTIINGFTQNVPVHHLHTSIYDFMDELANEKVIELNTAIKPYSRKFIYSKLKEAEQKQEDLNKRQTKDLNFYLNIYAFDGDLGYNPYSENAKLNILKNPPDSYRDINTGINPLGLFYKDSSFSFSLKPIWGIRYYTNQEGQVQHTWGGAEAYATVGKNWSIYASLRDNYQTEILAFPQYFTTLEGGNYKVNVQGRQGGDYSEMRGGINYSWKWGSIGLVKDHLQWGNNYKGANIFSGNQPSFGMIKLQLSPVPWLDFNYYHGWLVSEVVDSTRSYTTSNGDWRAVYRDKYIAANMYTFKPFKNFHFSIGNSIVYSDVNPQLEYLIPFLFYKSVDHTLNHGIDNQNSQMFGDFSFRMIKHSHLYGTIFIDEFSISRIGKDEESNFYGYKLGSKLNNWPIKNTYITFEYTKTSPITYKHRVPTLTYESNKHNLGHYLRDNSKEYYINIGVKPIRGLKVEISYLNAKHGNEYQYTDGNEAVLLPFMESVSWSNESYSLKILYEFISESYLFFDFTASNIKGYDVDGQTAQYYLNLFTPAVFQGKTETFTLGFNIGY